MARHKPTRKVRTDFRKNRKTRARERRLTEQFNRPEDTTPTIRSQQERLSGKGDVTRRRTIVGTELTDDSTGMSVIPQVDTSLCLAGTVLRAGGLTAKCWALTARPTAVPPEDCSRR